MNDEIKNVNKGGIFLIVGALIMPFIIGRDETLNGLFTSPILWIYVSCLFLLLLALVSSKIFITESFIEKKNMFISSRMEYVNIKNVIVQATYFENSFISYITFIGNTNKKMTIQISPFLSNKTAIAKIFKGVTSHVEFLRDNQSMLIIANGDVTEQTLINAAADKILSESFSWKRVFILLFSILIAISVILYFVI